MPYRLAINGYGRIGRSILRALYERQQEQLHGGAGSDAIDQLKIVAINEPSDLNAIAHLTKYDSTHGRFAGRVALEGQDLLINQDHIVLSQYVHLDELNWRDQHVDLVMECSGTFSDRASAAKHLTAGANRVVFSQPADPDVDFTVVHGVNQQQLRSEHQIISNASCTTNCIVPVIDALNRALGVEAGTITTIHSAMNDQPVIDAFHHTDLRKTRAAGQSIIPIDTGLAKGIDRLLPELAGSFTAQAVRVPTINVSVIDLVVTVSKDTTAKEVNAILQQAAETGYDGVMGYTDEALASCDFNHDIRSVVVDAGQTRVSKQKMVKVMCWFDNEWAFANRMLDVALTLSQLD